MTLKEIFGKNLKGRKIVFAGDIKNNVARSVMIGAAFMGMDCVLCGPKDQHDLVKNGKGYKEV